MNLEFSLTFILSEQCMNKSYQLYTKLSSTYWHFNFQARLTSSYQDCNSVLFWIHLPLILALGLIYSRQDNQSDLKNKVSCINQLSHRETFTTLSVLFHAEDQTQGFVQPRQALCYWASTTVCVNYIRVLLVPSSPMFLLWKRHNCSPVHRASALTLACFISHTPPLNPDVCHLLRVPQDQGAF